VAYQDKVRICDTIFFSFQNHLESVFAVKCVTYHKSVDRINYSLLPLPNYGVN